VRPEARGDAATVCSTTAPPEVDTTTLTNITGIGGESGVDAKVKGGQVVVAPSLHANSRPYAWTGVGAVAWLPMAWALELIKIVPPPAIQKYTPQTIRTDTKARRRSEKYLEAAVIGNSSALAACGEPQWLLMEKTDREGPVEHYVLANWPRMAPIVPHFIPPD
jgi:hypothetical protein